MSETRTTIPPRLAVDDAVLLMVDHQAGLLSLVADYSPEEFRNNVLGLVRLASYFRRYSALSMRAYTYTHTYIH